MTTDQLQGLIDILKVQYVKDASGIQDQINNLKVLLNVIISYETQLNEKLCTTVKNADTK